MIGKVDHHQAKLARRKEHGQKRRLVTNGNVRKSKLQVLQVNDYHEQITAATC